MINQTQIKNLMTEMVNCVRTVDSMKSIQGIFTTHSFHHLPVIDADEKVVGIISRSDYQKIQEIFSTLNDFGVEMASNNFARSMTAEEIMTKPIVTIHPDATIEFALGIFRENLFHAMPVVDRQNRLVGILSTYDLLFYAYDKAALIVGEGLY